jgi:hypothetical protein
VADNETTGTGKAVATDKVTYSGDADQNVQLIRDVLVTGSEGSKTVSDKAFGTGAVGSTVQRVVLANDERVVNPQGYFVTCQTDVTRPADTTVYAIDDALSDSTSAPTSGGFTFTGAARASGKSGVIIDAIITSSNDPASKLQGEIWLFDTSVTNINDNAAFAVSDSEIKTCVGKIPFTLEDSGNNQFYHAQNLNIGFTCSGSDNLHFLVRVKNVYTPANAEVLTFKLKIMQVD